MQRKAKNFNFDPQLAASFSYNDEAGAQKNIEVGPKLDAIKIATGSYTTDATTRRLVGAGTQIAIYNNSAVVHAATFGDATVTAGAAGAVTVTGVVSIPCKPNNWSYLSAEADTYIITDNAALLVFIVRDHTKFN